MMRTSSKLQSESWDDGARIIAAPISLEFSRPNKVHYLESSELRRTATRVLPKGGRWSSGGCGRVKVFELGFMLRLVDPPRHCHVDGSCRSARIVGVSGALSLRGYHGVELDSMVSSVGCHVK